MKTLHLITFTLLILFNYTSSIAQQQKSTKEVRENCELDSIEGEVIISSYPDLNMGMKSLYKNFLKVAKFKRNPYNPPTKLYTSFVLTPENKILNFCSTVSFENYNEIETYLLEWVKSNQVQHDQYIRIPIYFSCLKWK